MGVSIVVPFFPDGAERDRNWAYLKQRYRALFPDWELVESSCSGPWRKGVAVNAAVAQSTGDVLVISDADVVIPEVALRQAVERLEDHPWVVPHRLVCRLNEQATRLLIEGHHPDGCEAPKRGAAGGGMLVTRREDFDAVRGVDERFEGWGGEDISFGRALDTLVGSHRRLGSVLWHMHHEPMFRREGNRASPESEALAAKYLDASGDEAAMGRLLAERPYSGIEGGGIVIASREVILSIPPDERFVGWGQEDESWGIALSCLAGAPWRGSGPLFHLQHAPPPRASRTRGSPEGWNLRRRYCRARHDPQAMKALIEEARALTADKPRLHDHQAA